MLWSPSEVLAYLKDDKLGDIDEKLSDRLVPTASYGGFKTWPKPKQDFILIAENSEIHGPNPLFTIPELDASIDLNLLSTQILSADYQGLSNNKILPGKNAQLLMPDIDADIHAAIVYFFLFDCEARGFVRPLCVAFFTSDKYKLANLSDTILKRLTEISSILQHFNTHCSADDLKSMKENCLNEENLTKSSEMVNDVLLKDIQEILDTVNKYNGNNHFDKQLSALLNILEKKSTSEEIRSWVLTSIQKSNSTSDAHKRKLSFRANSKIHMRDLFQICGKGIVLSLYHLYISYQFLKRKGENIDVSDSSKILKENCLRFGACIKNSKKKNTNGNQSDCILECFRIPSTFAFDNDAYLSCLNSSFENVILRFLKWGLEPDCKNVDNADNNSPQCSDIVSNSYSFNLSCGHIFPLSLIWDYLEFNLQENPAMEETFLKILKLFNDSQRLFYSVLTRSPIIVISTPHQLKDAINFISALSIFVPRKKEETKFVDLNREDPITEGDLNNYAIVNVCVNGQQIAEDVVPLELMSGMCVVNLKDCSLTAPTYSGRLLNDLDQRLKIIPPDGAVFPVIVGILSEIELALGWWHMMTSSSMEESEVSVYVLSKGYTRSDMQIIEKLYKIWEKY